MQGHCAAAVQVDHADAAPAEPCEPAAPVEALADKPARKPRGKAASSGAPDAAAAVAAAPADEQQAASEQPAKKRRVRKDAGSAPPAELAAPGDGGTLGEEALADIPPVSNRQAVHWPAAAACARSTRLQPWDTPTRGGGACL
jgi:hypothetical protein